MSRHAAVQLERALIVNFMNFAGRVTLEDMVSQPWASVTFSGARHGFTLLMEGESAGEAAAAFLAELETREFALHGHILADLAIVGDPRILANDCVSLSFEALTIEETC